MLEIGTVASDIALEDPAGHPVSLADSKVGNRYPDWQQAVAARSALRLGGNRPGRFADHPATPSADSTPHRGGRA